jgi:UDPglucose 6-dehydrogenase
VQALAKSAGENNYEFKILNSVMEVNETQKKRLVVKLRDYYGEDGLKGKRFALWGLAFKPETDDIREAPALYIIDELLAAGASVIAYDPEGMPNVKKLLGDKIEYAADRYSALDGADALLIVTEWPVFRTPDFDFMKEKLNAPVIFDGRNLYDLDRMKDHGFYYNSIGRKVIS